MGVGFKESIEIPAEPADPAKLPALLKDFKAVPPLATDIDLSLDDKVCTSPAGEQANLLHTMVSDPSTRRRLAQCGSAAL